MTSITGNYFQFLAFSFSNYCQFNQCPNLMNLSRGLKSAKNRFKLSTGLNSLNSVSIRFSIYFQRKNLLNIIWNLFNIQCYFINTSLYPRSKFEFEQDLPSLYRIARLQRVLTRSYGTVCRPNQTNIRQGSIFLA